MARKDGTIRAVVGDVGGTLAARYSLTWSKTMKITKSVEQAAREIGQMELFVLITYPTGEPATLTLQQVESVQTIGARFALGSHIVVHPLFGCGGAVGVQAGGMTIAIEQDGYRHT